MAAHAVTALPFVMLDYLKFPGWCAPRAAAIIAPSLGINRSFIDKMIGRPERHMDGMNAGVLDWSDLRPGVVRFLTKRTGCPIVAEDLTQDLWLRLHRSDHDARNPIAYLFAAAANVAFDWRQRERRSVSDVVDEEDVVQDEAPSPERIAAGRQGAALLSAAIAELPPKCRTAFMLCRMEGLTMRAAGARMGVSERTVENHLAKATLHCRKRLLEAGAWP